MFQDIAPYKELPYEFLKSPNLDGLACYHFSQCSMHTAEKTTKDVLNGVLLQLLSPYTLELNPIELYWGIVKKNIS